MTGDTGKIDLPCHVCGYDLRAHPQDGKCPECGASVAESQRMAAIPRRPAWRDSDPRWRRRMLAGVWVLVFLPLVDVLTGFEWASQKPIPTIFDYYGPITLNETLLCSWAGVYQAMVFCIGVVLLFSKERGRRRAKLDWTRRWGVLCSYVVFLLRAAQILFPAALVLAGISAVFLSIPLKYQPGVTRLFIEMSTRYLRYGPYPKDSVPLVLVAFSSIANLLACIPLFGALASTGSKRLAAILVAPLGIFSLMHLWQAGQYWLGSSSVASDVLNYGVYFWSELVAHQIANRPYDPSLSGPVPIALSEEAAKWCIVVGIAVRLTIAQVATWRRGKTAVDDARKPGELVPSDDPTAREPREQAPRAFNGGGQSP
jgi:hypothetical protein